MDPVLGSKRYFLKVGKCAEYRVAENLIHGSAAQCVQMSETLTDVKKTERYLLRTDMGFGWPFISVKVISIKGVNGL